MKKLLVGLLALGALSSFAKDCNYLNLGADDWNTGRETNQKICANISPTSNGFVITEISPAVSPRRHSTLPTLPIGTKSNIGKELCKLLTGKEARKAVVVVAKGLVDIFTLRGNLRGFTRNTRQRRAIFPSNPRVRKNKYISSIDCIGL